MRRRLSLLVLLLLLLSGAFFYVFNRSKNSSSEPITLQWHTAIETPVIIFVHGLGGDAYSTWGEAGSSFMELLTADPAFADYGIASVRYPSRIFGHSPSVPELASSFANCLDKSFSKNSEIVIIAHSLGGIIARRGLVESHWRNRQHQFVTLITLASPFDGSQLPDFAKILSAFNISSRQMQALGIRSDVLQLCDKDWRNLVAEHGSRIRQFAASEGRPIESLVTVVSSASATQDVPRDCVFHSTKDTHFSIAKPVSLKDGIGNQVRNWALLALKKREYKKAEYTVDQNIEIPAGGVLAIEAGATLNFRKGAKILCKGRLDAKGKKDEEITFDFDESSDAESGVVLRGPDVAGSQFLYCRFRHGNGIGIQKPNPASVNLPSNELWGEKQTILTSVGNSYGGAVLLIGAMNVKFTQCEFMNNRAFMGGAMAVLGSRRIQINSSAFHGNSSGNGGGAIFAQSSDLYIEGKCEFQGNKTGAIVEAFSSYTSGQNACGGALYIGFDTHCDVRDTIFTKNAASNAGGAIFMQDTNPPASQVTAINQLHQIHFVANESYDGEGGALRADGESRGHLSNVTFQDNYARPQADLPGPAFSDASRAGFQVTDVSWTRKGKKYEETYRTEKSFAKAAALAGRPVIDELMVNPNSYKPADQRITDTIVIHYMSANAWSEASFRSQFTDKIKEFESSAETKAILENPSEAQYDWRLCKEILELYGISCHYLIDRSGVIHRLVQDKNIAFHAGPSIMPEGDDRQNVNDFSLGIELISTDPQKDEDLLKGNAPAFTPEQYDALVDLLLELSRKYRIPGKNIVGHSDIAGVRAVEKKLRNEKDKKEDPGSKFDWEMVRKRVEAGLKENPKPLLQASVQQAEQTPTPSSDF